MLLARATPFRLASAAFAALALAAVPASCGGSDGEPAAATPAAQPIVVVERTGGFLPAGAAFGRVPLTYVTADGVLVTPGPQITIFPPPALENLFTRTLSDEAVEQLRQLAREAQLDGPPPDYGRPGIADASTTRVTYVAEDGRTYVHEAYALGATGADGSPARVRLREFVTALNSPGASLGEDGLGASEPYEAPAFEVAARSLEDAGGSPAAQDEPVDWPLASIRLAAAAGCTPVTGPDADTLRAALHDADTRTRWAQGGVLYEVSNRPVLPGELACR